MRSPQRQQMNAVEVIAMVDIPMRDVGLLIAFDALMTDRSVTRTAARLGLTQQGLSGQLARLRQGFGDPLFVRHGTGILPTPRAEVLHPRIADALAALRAVADAPVFEPATFAGVVSVAATDYAIALLLPTLLSRLRAAAPQLRLAVLPVEADALAAQMHDRQVDLALSVPQFVPPGLRSQRILRERYVGAARADHPISHAPVTLDAFCAHPQLLVSPNRHDFRGPTDDALAAVGRKRDVALVLPSFSVVTAILEQTELIAVLPERLVARSRRPLFRFDPPVTVPGFELHALWPERLTADPMHRWLRRLAFAAFDTLRRDG